MNKTGKTIQIYLPDGNPRGLKIADITSRTKYSTINILTILRRIFYHIQGA